MRRLAIERPAAIRSGAMPRAAAILVFVLAALAAPDGALAAVPPNRADPCASAGRNTCGTLGVGFHQTYRYGIRWFGDFRRVAPGVEQAFCIDLRFWYASPAYRYRTVSSSTLRNADGKRVPVRNLQQMAYAIWRYGRSADPEQQAAAALYVHSLMGDARPGEVDPAGLRNATVSSLYDRIARDATRYRGPYRVEVVFPGRLAAGKRGRALIRVRSGAGVAIPNLRLELSGSGASGIARSASTGANGVATVPFTPTGAETVRLSVATGLLSATLPRVLRATTAAAAPNAQRLAAPSSQRLSATATAPVTTRITASTVAVPNPVAVGEPTRDRVTIQGARASWRGTVQVLLYGPFPSAAEVRCDGTPAWTGSYTQTGPGTTTTPPARLAQAGWYTYREIIPGDKLHVGLTTPCGVPEETFPVEAQPRVRTTISALRASVGAPIFDRIFVQGLAGQTATVEAALYGPFPTRAAITCDSTPVWRGSLVVTTDGEQRTEPFTVTSPGFYTYRERLVAGELVRASETGCGETTETTLVRARPGVTTIASSEVVRKGGSIFDRIRVEGLGGAAARIQVELFGPFASRSAIRCAGRPHWTGTVVARGDGVLVSPRVKVARAGFYTYRERLLESPLVTGTTTPCPLAVETSLATPEIATGRGDVAGNVSTRSGDGSRPVRVRLSRVGIDAPVAPVGIDVRAGVLGVPADIARTGWWSDGMPPGASAGAVLIAGHVDSAQAGPGAFYSLHRSQRGDEVLVATADGRVIAYRVDSVRYVLRKALPTSVFSRTGSPRLVLVTCGGPFDRATGHYRDNVVVTASPAARASNASG